MASCGPHIPCPCRRSHAARLTHTSEVGIARQRRAEPYLDARSDRAIDRRYIDDSGRAIRTRLQADTPIAGEDDKRAFRRQHGAGNYA